MKLLYGSEFWQEIEVLLSNARQRVFLASAYMNEPTYRQHVSLLRADVFHFAVCRSDSSFVPKDKCLVFDKTLFHGKIYLIDNDIIIGSQNLYNVNKEGEFSVLISADESTSARILYEAFLKVIEPTNVTAEPVDERFLDFYDDGCPFCGNQTADSVSIFKCSGYGGGFVSDEDCDSYGGSGACKYCLPEMKESLGECFCCDSSGCGFGIALDSGSLIYHEFEPPLAENAERAKAFLRLFNFVSRQIGAESIPFFQAFGFTGRIFQSKLEKKEWQVVD